MAGTITQALKNGFVPHAGNDHKPHLLRPRTITFVLIVMIAAEAAFLLGSAYLVPRIKLFGLIETSALIDETNQQRTATGEQALTVSPLLMQAAQDKANDMVANDYFAHTSPSGVTPWDWFEKVGYQFSYAGENLAVNFANSQDVTNAWMNSPEHRANILNAAFTQIGMAAAQGTYNGQPAIYVVELFGTPASQPVAFVSTATAASVSNPAPAVTPAASSTPPPAGAASSKPKTKPVVSVPVTAAPVVVASASVENSSTQQLFVAVKGVETQTVPATTTSVVPAAVTVAATAPAARSSNAFSSAFQWLMSDPRAVANDFYIFLIALFLVASTINFFVKIRFQYPRLIFGGLAVIVIAGLCVMLNQTVGLSGVAIL